MSKEWQSRDSVRGRFIDSLVYKNVSIEMAVCAIVDLYDLKLIELTGDQNKDFTISSRGIQYMQDTFGFAENSASVGNFWWRGKRPFWPPNVRPIENKRNFPDKFSRIAIVVVVALVAVLILLTLSSLWWVR